MGELQSSLQAEGKKNTFATTNGGAWDNVLVKALCYKPEGYGFDTLRGELICFFQFT
jgi:hypothetical protein